MIANTAAANDGTPSNNTTTNSVGQPTADGSSWMEQTQYIARTIYEDPTVKPVLLDLHSACALGYYDQVKEAIERKEKLNSHNKGGWTPLMYASYVGHDTVVNLLLEAEVNPNKSSPTGLTPLMVAAGCGNESVCYFLLLSKADINQQDDQGYTALHLATRQGHHSTVQLLLKEGADVEIGDSNGYTPLMIAALQGDQIVLDVLIACSANVNAKGNDGHTARSLALRNGDIKTVSFLDEVQMMYFAGNVSTTSNECDDEESLHSGPEMVEEMIRKTVQKNLGYRSGQRRSLPTSIHRPSIISSNRRMKFRASFSLPESDLPPAFLSPTFEEESLDDSMRESEDGDGMAKLAEFLYHVGLEKYYDAFEAHDIDFNGLLQLSAEDMKKIIDKMGPRRRLEVAVKQVKEEMQQELSSGSVPCGDTTPTPFKENEKELKVQVMRLQSTLTQVTQNLEGCEQRLSKEYELRKMAERYCQELQQCRAQTMDASKALKETLTSLLKHCRALKLTQDSLSKISRELSKDQVDLSALLDWIKLISKLGGEVEAVSRSAQQCNRDYKAVNYQLNSFSP